MTQISKNKTFKCGFVSIVGRPNVGKSTLVNSILRNNISIVTRKPQTTRNRILGIYTMPEYQAIFIDTPGIHINEKKTINRVMNKTAINAMMDTNLNLFVCDSSYWSEEDEVVLNQLKNARSPSILLLNKIDLIHPKDKLLELISTLSNKHDFSEVIPIMAKNRDSLKSLLSIIPKFLPNSPQLYESEMITDRSRVFITSEKIREKLILQLNQEIPYGLSVEIDKFSEETKQITIDAMIWVEKNGQKGIVVGKDGSTLKKIGTSARLDLKNYFKKNIHLNLWVKVKSNWADSKKELSSMGFEI
jgi:GTP-binding protein Era